MSHIASSIQGDFNDPAPEAIISLDVNGRVLMTRDMDLIRKILLKVETWTDITPKVVDIDDEPDKIKIFRHVEMLCAAGMLEPIGGPQAHMNVNVRQLNIKDMTWEGHEFVATLKNDTVWNKIKSSFSAQQIAHMPIETLKAVALGLSLAWAKRAVGLTGG